MQSDPEHIVDVIDGVVDDWEAMSADSMRWAPPETKEPDLFDELTEIVAPLVNAAADILRPVGEAIERVMDHLIEGGPDDRDR
ncbi:hypothetical protein [Nonomuraea endophytica]|uniref:Uncharacterized protein n=1 Tax=Nonomuraea endophytica TaxID=714136 RepID=A0A7W8EDV4_9ACTN|nr:hypothetical protein [Nonomuraea endophytica]MBB5075773.1 hypothetical protein [Nonomuraea endophytica]